MGRHYQDELRELPATSLGEGTQVLQLARAVAASRAQPLLVVASGGAQVAARWLAHLHLAAFGRPATVLSPLELLSLSSVRDSAIWLVSQGGQHSDIMSAAKWAVQRAPLSTYALVGRGDSLLAGLVDAHGGLSSSLQMAPGADGFLTTNGLWAMLCALTRGYLPYFADADPAVGELPLEDILQWAEKEALAIPEKALQSSFAVVADPWTIIGARDLELRATEASLAHVWITDYRNLGHGRHFWLADRAKSTTALFMPSPRYLKSDRWTREDLPRTLTQLIVPVPFEGLAAGLASVAFSIHLVARLGLRLGRDPGRPGVPAFGERLYAGDITNSAAPNGTTTFAQRAVASKLGVSPASIGVDTHAYWFDAWHAYRQNLHQRSFKALVFDYDGTLVFSHHRWGDIPNELGEQLRRLLDQGLYLGVATGRGDSVQKVLQKALKGSDLNRVLVGYHNGASVRPLNASASDLDGACADAKLAQAFASLSAKLGPAADVQKRANQCTVKPCDGSSLLELWTRVRETLDLQLETAQLAAWLSSHSVDICAPGASKLSVTQALTSQHAIEDEAILRLGDRGAWPGNDFQLLNHVCGVSVDECSLHPARCWNLTDGIGTGPKGILAILRRLVLNRESGSAWLDLGDGA